MANPANEGFGHLQRCFGGGSDFSGLAEYSPHAACIVYVLRFSILGFISILYALVVVCSWVRRLTQTDQIIQPLFDLDGNRIAEYDVDEVAGTSTLLREYIWMDGMPVAVVQGGVVYYIRVDHIGRPVFATDSSANIVWEVNYLPFGGIESSSGTILDLRFPGQWFQLESGLHQNWMRDYDPTTGRYMQADPLGLVDGASVYGYARQNPMRYTDRRGEKWIPYSLPDGNTGMTWVPGGSTYCPSGDCGSVNPTENIRKPWPEYEACVQTCSDSEPMLDIDSWWPISESSRAQCSIILGATNALIRGGWLGRGASQILGPGCRRDFCEQECLSTCEQ